MAKEVYKMVIIHQDDGQAWAGYLKTEIGRRRFHDMRLDIEQVENEVLLSDYEMDGATSGRVKNADFVILVGTPNLKDYLKKNSDAKYIDFNFETGRFVLFFCGTQQSDWERPGSKAKYAKRFTDYNNYLKIQHSEDNFEDVISSIIQHMQKTLIAEGHKVKYDNPARVVQSEPGTNPTNKKKPVPTPPAKPDKPKSGYVNGQNISKLMEEVHFHLSPAAVQLEYISDEMSISKLLIILKEPLRETQASDLNIKLVNEEDSSEEYFIDKVDIVNPFTLSFTCPTNLRIGAYHVNLYLNSQSIGTNKLNCVANFEFLYGIHQIYLRLLQVLAKHMDINIFEQLDKDFAREVFDDQDLSNAISPAAFEQFLGTYEGTRGTSTRDELPSILHFAAKYNLKDLLSNLVSLPGASFANEMRSKHNKIPSDLTSNSTIQEFFSDFNETADVYEAMAHYKLKYDYIQFRGNFQRMLPYYNHAAKDELYIDMTGRGQGYVNVKEQTGYQDANKDQDEDYVEVEEEIGPRRPDPSSTSKKAQASAAEAETPAMAPTPPPKPVQQPRTGKRTDSGLKQEKYKGATNEMDKKIIDLYEDFKLGRLTQDQAVLLGKETTMQFGQQLRQKQTFEERQKEMAALKKETEKSGGFFNLFGKKKKQETPKQNLPQPPRAMKPPAASPKHLFPPSEDSYVTLTEEDSGFSNRNSSSSDRSSRSSRDSNLSLSADVPPPIPLRAPRRPDSSEEDSDEEPPTQQPALPPRHKPKPPAPIPTAGKKR